MEGLADLEGAGDLDALMDDDGESDAQETPVGDLDVEAELAGLDDLVGDEGLAEAPAAETPEADTLADDSLGGLDEGLDAEAAPETALDDAFEALDDTGEEELSEPSEVAAESEADIPSEAPSLEDLLGQEPSVGEAAPEEMPASDAEDDEDVDVRTGLPTPARFEGRLEEDWQLAEESNLEVSLILVDVERALEQAGDELIPEVADLISDRYGELGVVARADLALISVLLSSVPLDEAAEVARMIRASLMEAFPAVAEHIVVGVTAKTHANVDSVDDFVTALQDAMEEGAAAGEGLVVYG